MFGGRQLFDAVTDRFVGRKRRHDLLFLRFGDAQCTKHAGANLIVGIQRISDLRRD